MNFQKTCKKYIQRGKKKKTGLAGYLSVKDLGWTILGVFAYYASFWSV